MAMTARLPGLDSPVPTSKWGAAGRQLAEGLRETHAAADDWHAALISACLCSAETYGS